MSVVPPDTHVRLAVMDIARWVETTAELVTGTKVQVLVAPPDDPARPVLLEMHVYREARGRLLGVEGRTVRSLRAIADSMAKRLGVAVTLDVVAV